MEWQLCLVASELTPGSLEDEDGLWMNHFGTHEDIIIDIVRNSLVGDTNPIPQRMPQAAPDMPHLRLPTAQSRRVPPLAQLAGATNTTAAGGTPTIGMDVVGLTTGHWSTATAGPWRGSEWDIPAGPHLGLSTDRPP